MKKILIVALLSALLCSGAFAQDTPCPNVPAGPKTPGQQVQTGGMMQMCAPMMKHMMGQAVMTRDLMQLLKEVIQVEQKIVKGVSARERKPLLADLDEKLKRIDKIMDDMRKGIMQGPPPASAPPAGDAKQAVPGHAH